MVLGDLLCNDEILDDTINTAKAPTMVNNRGEKSYMLLPDAESELT